MATEAHNPRGPTAAEIVRAMCARNAPRRAEVERRLERMRRYAAALRERRA